MSTIPHLFAGPGGLETGLRAAGYRGEDVGFENNEDACATARAAGHNRICIDVTQVSPGGYAGSSGITATPPCPSWSQLGLRLGPKDRESVLNIIDAYAHSVTPPEPDWNDPRSALTAEPMRWIVELRPSWIVCEQVPGALPLWQHMARHLREDGYSAVAGVLHTEEYGVPQTRRRAVLIARRDGVPAALPVPTHQRYRRKPSGLPRWVSMHDAIGWGLIDRPAWTVTGGGTRTGGAEFFGNARCRAILGGRRLTVPEAAALQTFPEGYPFQGNKGSRSQQIGDAVPPVLGMAIFRTLPLSALEEAA